MVACRRWGAGPSIGFLFGAGARARCAWSFRSFGLFLLLSFLLLQVRRAFVGTEFTWFEICSSTLGSIPRPWRFNCPSNDSHQTSATTMACACLSGDRGNIADGVMHGALRLTRIGPNGWGITLWQLWWFIKAWAILWSRKSPRFAQRICSTPKEPTTKKGKSF